MIFSPMFIVIVVYFKFIQLLILNYAVLNKKIYKTFKINQILQDNTKLYISQQQIFISLESCFKFMSFVSTVSYYQSIQQSKNISNSDDILIQYKRNKTLITKIIYMGGNAFEDLQKLTPEQYLKITKEVLQLVAPICHIIQPYIPLPEKQIHGDVDFLIIFKEGFGFQQIIELMKLEKGQYILNNNQTANTAYHKKQIDFNAAANEQQFQRCRFYKSYGGLGAFLGLMLPSKTVKFNEDGLFCCFYQQHIKMEFNVSNNINEIMTFHGLSPEAYQKGFNTRNQLFEFLLQTRFLEPTEFVSKEPKYTTKLINFFQQYLAENVNNIKTKSERWENPLQQTLKYFKKEEKFEVAWKEKLGEEAGKKERANKWNGKHIIDIFGVATKEVNKLKHLFQNSFLSKTEYEKFIDTHTFVEIRDAFCKVCNIPYK